MSDRYEMEKRSFSSGPDYPVTITQEAVLLVREVMRQRNMIIEPDWMRILLRLSGPLQVPVLHKALNAVVRRHAALRTHFLPNKGIPPTERIAEVRSFSNTGIFTPGLYVQHLAEESVALLSVTDFTGVPEADRQSLIQERCDSECSRESSCRSRSLIRADLIRLAPEVHLLFIFVDHLVCDDWSVSVIKRDLLTFYAQFLMSDPPSIVPTELSYLDYALWQRDEIARKRFETNVMYWRDQWAEYGDARIANSELPFSVAHPVAQFDGPGTTNAKNDLTEEMSSAAVRCARELGATPHTFFLSAFCILLRHYTGRNKLACMGHFANRSRPEMADVVGWLTHSHLIGIDIPPEITIAELVAQTKRKLLSALAHDQMPPPLLWQVLRCSPRIPDGRVLLDTYRETKSPVSLPDRVIVESLAPPEGNGPRFSNLGVYVSSEGSRIVLRTQTSLSVFSQDAAAIVAKDLMYVIGQLVSRNVQTPVAAVPMPERYGVGTRATAATNSEMSEYIVLGSRLIPLVSSGLVLN